jgi:hypothetical protein
MTNDEKRDYELRGDMAELVSRQRRQEKIIAFMAAIILILSLVVFFSLIRSNENVAPSA